MEINFEDIIVASATKLSTQAISIIRVSGKGAIKLVNKIINKDLIYQNGFYLRKIIKDGSTIDESLLLVFQENKSFTGDETVEINCHGGVLLTTTIINLLISKGARMAYPGEFSQRAYLNGKIDLIQAESINNLINSKNDLAIKLNAKMLVDKNINQIEVIKKGFLEAISKLQTAIDYPEYEEVQNTTVMEVCPDLIIIKNEIINIINNSKNLLYINEGIKTLILGETNVGKSSLLNSLLKEDKAIVTDIEGTTRDVVEGTIYFKNFNLDLIDSAGVRKTKDKVELLGIEKTLNLINKSNLILFVINKEKYDLNLYNNIKEKEHIVILNKADLLTDTEINELKHIFPSLVSVSAKNKNVDELKKTLERKYSREDILDKDFLLLTNLKHIQMFEDVLKLLNLIEHNISLGFDIDIILIDLKKAFEIINSILGFFDSNDEILDNIFRKYCLGK
ncbi:tRNA modification GTPase TrmE [Spiroplasma corruscae]|uniref:tRNA modification GTPase MnmE n=1 Tax=Spiroplasma corruscae TaxID=216934 RepID=A0A222EQH4_9MOLU|nr:tRNA uridine-5-carboxymethylaminomethyl(34) synthesis GTPase MnmE [Spiroplasma corruscae]ASP28779.1 tRNA modification GTPase TrmE [Spiroplasma corruscae]